MTYYHHIAEQPPNNGQKSSTALQKDFHLYRRLQLSRSVISVTLQAQSLPSGHTE